MSDLVDDPLTLPKYCSKPARMPQVRSGNRLSRGFRMPTRDELNDLKALPGTGVVRELTWARVTLAQLYLMYDYVVSRGVVEIDPLLFSTGYHPKAHEPEKVLTDTMADAGTQLYVAIEEWIQEKPSAKYSLLMEINPRVRGWYEENEVSFQGIREYSLEKRKTEYINRTHGEFPKGTPLNIKANSLVDLLTAALAEVKKVKSN